MVRHFTKLLPSDRLYLVVDAVVDALTSQVPRDRYVVGLEAQLVILAATWLPTSGVDLILRCLFSLKIPKPKGCRKI